MLRKRPTPTMNIVDGYNPIDGILDAIDLKYLEKYIRKRKLEKIKYDKR